MHSIASAVRAQSMLTSKSLRAMAVEIRRHSSRPDTDEARRAFNRIAIALDQHATDLNTVGFQ